MGQAEQPHASPRKAERIEAVDRRATKCASVVIRRWE
jgi:hypothetical protein